ncbi:MAG: molybdopterin-binding protein [Chloroflexia bacterium]|nr:molybdopterin-binding protein [Chloroflexia bacterium]
MRLQLRSTNQSIGAIARHNISDALGRRLVSKGRVISAADVVQLQLHGIDQVYVVQLDGDDVDEHTAATMVAVRCSQRGVRILPPHHGRVDVVAESSGVLVVNDQQLQAWHCIDGVTIATVAGWSAVTAGQRIATIKILPFALPRQCLTNTPRALLAVYPFVRRRVAVVMIGNDAVSARLQRTHIPPLAARLVPVMATIVATLQCDTDSQAVAHALHQATTVADIVITVAETSIMDRDDVMPQGLRHAGGDIICYGAPVEPGNLLLLGQLAGIPVIGAPGCIRGHARNVVDELLPRIGADFLPSAADVYALANGGLLASGKD